MGLFSVSVGKGEGGKQNQKAKLEDIFSLLQPSTYWAASFAHFFICGRDANQESEQFLSERAVQDVKE